MAQVNGRRQGGTQQAAALVRAAEWVSGGNLLGVGKFAGWTRALGGILVAAACTPALAGPEGAQVVRGQVDITRNGAETLIRAGNNSIINYKSFNIGANESVRFIQPSSTSRVLNRITTAAPTRIDGSITANGRVYIVNPAGVIFGNGARVDVNALYAAGGKLSNADFLAGRDNFTNLTGRVENQGTITVQKFAGLVGEQVFNSGTINAPRGTVVMASGSDVMIGERTGNVYVKIKAPTGDVKAGTGTANTGVVNAAGGRVIMGAGDIYSIAVRAAGSVKANDISVQASGGNVEVAGTLDASNARGNGGSIEVLGERVSLVNAKLNATGQTGGGQVHVGGDYQGLGDRERAKVVTVDAGSTIDVSATEKGNGGTAIVWSDNYTQFHGTGLARGGAMGGDGGLIETSSKDVVSLDPAKIDAGSIDGNGGTWLIDPRNVTISSGATTEMTPSGGSPNTFTPTTTGASSNVNVADIQTSLNGGTSVIVTTAQAGVADAGNITVQNSITKSAGGNATLTLRAQNDITIDAGVTISATAGQLGVTLEANSATGDTASGTGSVFLNGTINTNGGAFSSSGVGFTQSGTGVITAGGGVTINHTGAVALGGAITGGAVDVNAGAGGISLAGNVITSGDSVRFQDAVTLTGSASIDTTGSSSAAGANITFDSTIEGTTAGAENLTLNAGTGGDITLTGAAGGTTRLGAVAITNADDVTAAGLRSTTLTQTAGGGTTTLGGAVDTAGAIGLTATNITVNGDVTSAAGGISLVAGTALNITNKVTATTGDITATATTGTLTVNSTGAETGELDAAAGDTTLVTNTLTMTGEGGEFQVSGGGDVNIRSADNRGIRIGGGGGGFMNIAAATLENRIETVGGRVITLGNNSTSAIEVDEDLSIGNGLALRSAGDITWKDGGPDAPTVQALSLDVRSGMDGTGNIVFEDDADVLTDSASFQAGSLNGTNNAATFTGVNFLALRRIANTDAPASVVWASDAAITATQLPVLTVPAGGITYSIRSFGSTVTIGTAARINGTDLTIQGAGAGTDITTDVSLRSLTLNGTGVFDAVTTTSGGINAAGNATFSGAVSAAGAIAVSGSFDAVFSSTVTTTGGGISIGDDVNFGGAVSITGGNFQSGGDASIAAGLTTDGTATVGGSITRLTGTLRTDSGAVSVTGSVAVNGTGAIDTTNAGGSAGANVQLGSTLDGTAGGAADHLTVTAGTGNFTVTGASGAGQVLGDVLIESANDVSMGTVNAASLIQNNSGGQTTIGNITTTGAVRFGTVGTPLNDVTLGSVNASSLQAIVGNLNTVNLGGPVTLTGSFIHSGGQLNLSGNISTTTGFIQSTNLRLIGGSAIMLTASSNSTGIVLSAADLNGQNLTLVGDRVHFNGAANSIGGAGILTMRPVLNTDGITIGADDGTANILFVTGLAPLAATLTEVHFGNSTGGAHTINVPASTFLPDVTFFGNTVNVNGDLSTAGQAITIDADVSLASGVTIATDVGDAAGAAINITGDITRTNVAGGLTLSAGTDGDIDLDGDAGTSGAALANFTVTTADVVSANDVFATTISQAAANTATYGSLTGGAGGITLVGGAMNLGGAATSGGGAMQVTNSGLLTVSGSIALDGAFLQDGAGATSLTSAGAFTVSTTDDAITFTSGVSVNGTSVAFDAGSGTVTVGSTLTVGGGASFTVSADEIDFNGGANSVSGTGRLVLQPGTDGIDVEVGSALDQAGRLDLSLADLDALDNQFTSGVGAANTAIIIGRATGTQNINVNAGTFDNDVFFRGSGTGSVAFLGPVTGAGSLRADAGDITLGGDLAANGTLALVGDVLLTGNSTLTTSNDLIVLTGAVDAQTAGVQGLDIDAGSADVELNADVGATTRLGLFRVLGGHTKYGQSITVNAEGVLFDGLITATGSSGNRDLTIDSGAGNLTLLQNVNAVNGAVDLTGAVITTVGSITGGDINATGTTLNIGALVASGHVTLTGDVVNQDGAVTSDSYVASSQGAIVVSDDITATAVDGIRILSGLGGAGDLSFGATGVTLTSNTIELAAGDGTGAAVVNVRGNSPTFAGNSGSVSSFEVRQDGSISGTDLAEITQFTGGIAGMSYILNAVNGSLVIADSGSAANVAGSRLDLSALDNVVTGGIGISTDLTLEALQLRSVVTYGGATVAASDTIVHDGDVIIDGGVVFRAGDLDFTGAVTGLGANSTLDIETFAAGRDIFLGGDGTETGSGGTQALHLTASEIDLFADGLTGIRIGGASNNGTITVKSDVTFKDALTLRASAAGGSVEIEQTLKNTTSDGSVTILGSGSTTTISGSIVTQGQAITINDRVVVDGSALLDTTDAGAFATGADVSVGFDAGTGDAIADAINGQAAGADLAVRAGTSGVVRLARVGDTQHLDDLSINGAQIHLSSVATDGDQAYTGEVHLSELLRSHVAGSIVITGDLVVAGNSTIRTAGDNATDDITITGTVNADDAASNRDLTIAVGAVNQDNVQGQVSIGGAIGGVQALNDLVVSGDGTTLLRATTTGVQTYFGATQIAGNMSGSRIDFNDALTLAANVVLTASNTDSDAEQVEIETVNSFGGARTLTINALNTRINGDVGAVSKLASLTTDSSGRTRIGSAQVRTTGAQAYLDAVQLNNNVTMTTDAGSVRFASTIVSFGENRDLTVNTGGTSATQFEGLIGGTTDGEKLRNLTTNADGSVAFSANVRTTGAQTYDDATLLNANVSMSGASFEFASINSEALGARSLSITSTGSVIVNGAIGQGAPDTALGSLTINGGNMSFGGVTVNNAVALTSTGNIAHNGDVHASTYTASATTLDLLKIITSGNQTITGGVTLNDDLTATGAGSITLNGAVTLDDDVVITTNNQALSVSGAVNGAKALTVNVGTSTANFAADIGGTTALTSLNVTASSTTTRAVGTVGAQSYSGGLTTGFNHTTTGAGDITITGVLTLTGDAVFTTANGNLLYNGGVSGGESLTSHAGGAGKFSRFSGANAFQKLITEGQARIATTAISASEEMDFKNGVVLETSTTLTAPKATFRSVIDGAGMNLTMNVSGLTDFQGVVGGAGALGSITTDASGSTRLAANATTASGMVFNDAVTVGADIELRGGTGSLRFGKTIDSTSGTPFSLALFSDASANGTLANTPFVFGGSIGNASASTRLKSLTLSFQTDGNNVNKGAPLGATAFFATLNGDGTVAKGTDFRINTTQGFTMKPGQKLTSLGNLFINATNTGTVTLGDLTALGNITVTAGTVNIQLRGGSAVKNNPNDLGVDLVATGDISFGGVIPTLLNRSGLTEKERVSFANNSGVFNILTGAATDQFLFLKKANPVVENSFKDGGSFAPLDLTATGVSGVNAATIIAGAIPRDTETREVATPVTVSAALRKDLELMGMGIKDLEIEDLVEFLVGRAFYRDVPLTARPEPKDYRVTVNRLSTPSVQAAVDAYKKLVFLPGDINRTEAIRDSIALAWDAYTQQAQNPDGLGFREYLETKAASGGTGEAEALQFLNDTRMVFEKLDELGLSPAESNIPKMKLLGDIRPPAMDEGQISTAVLGMQLSSR